MSKREEVKKTTIFTLSKSQKFKNSASSNNKVNLDIAGAAEYGLSNSKVILKKKKNANSIPVHLSSTTASAAAFAIKNQPMKPRTNL